MAEQQRPSAPVSMRPSPTILEAIRSDLARFAPFSAMSGADVDRLLRGASLVYFEPGQLILEPDGAPPAHCWIIRNGSVVGERAELGTGDLGTWELGAGEMFPLGALLGARASTSRYRAARDTFCLAVTAAAFDATFRSSTPFSDFCTRRLGHLLDLARAEAQAAYLSDSNATLGLATPLGQMVRGAPVHCRRETPLGEALATMDRRKVGSMPVVDDSGRPVGIFTQHDVIGRVVLPQVPLSAPIAQVMSVPARTLPVHASAGDAVTLMVRHGVRHVLVVDDGRLVGVVSERDLFALQRLTSRQVGTAIRRAADVAELRQAAADIRALAKTLVVQGVGAGQLTRLLSDLNDQLTSRLLDLVSVSHDLSGVEACWMALGSEGRHEQTIATDQDNGLIFATQDDVERARARALAFAREVNEALAACGFPLCKGGVMASNPRWCATPAEWRATFAGWIDRGDPESLLGANVFFDFRPLWGAAGLADALREWVAEHARSNRRFLKQMADNALRNRAPLTVLGGIRAAGERNGEPAIDLKLNGSVPIVDAARIYALASGVTATSTSERLQRAGAELAIPAVEVRALVDAFEYIQLMRLRTQLAAAPDDPNPNLVALSAIGEIDARVLKEAFRHARRAQSRLEMDYPG